MTTSERNLLIKTALGVATLLKHAEMPKAAGLLRQAVIEVVGEDKVA